MNCLIKKKTHKTDKSHILSGKTHTFHINMCLIILIYQLINVFFDFPGAYFRKYTFKVFEMVTYFWHFKHKSIA